jgi:superfamily II DNA/RNA helicase
MLVHSGRQDFEKRETLRNTIRNAANFKNAIIFCNRKREVATLHRSLLRHKFNAVALHGDLDQSARTAALDAFRSGAAKLLIASDVAARGLDIPDVSHVFNFDVPHHPDDYVHRIGRTGRAGKSGTAITIATSADLKAVAAIEKLTGQPIPPTGEPIKAEAAEGDGHAGRERTDGRSRHPRSRGNRPSQNKDRPQAPAAPRPAQQGAAPMPAHAAAPKPAPAQSAAPKSRPPRDDGDADTSHLPAFLLRPVPVKA